MTEERICGLDLVQFRWNYTKTPEDNIKAYREAHYEVYGEYPPEPQDSEAP